jgi:hypothetical protein
MKIATCFRNRRWGLVRAPGPGSEAGLILLILLTCANLFRTA